MIFLVVRSELLEAAATRLLESYLELSDLIKIVEYSQFLSRTKWPVGTYLFTSTCELPEVSKRILSIVEEQLLSAECKLLNRPSRSPHRSELIAHDIAVPLKSLNVSEISFPVVLRSEEASGTVQTNPLNDIMEVEEAVTAMLMSGCMYDYMLALFPTAQTLKSGLLIGSEFFSRDKSLNVRNQFLGCLDVAWIEYRNKGDRAELFRIDDSPLALLPTHLAHANLKEEICKCYMKLDCGSGAACAIEVPVRELVNAIQA